MHITASVVLVGSEVMGTTVDQVNQEPTGVEEHNQQRSTKTDFARKEAEVAAFNRQEWCRRVWPNVSTWIGVIAISQVKGH